jgi:hypothetical protein
MMVYCNKSGCYFGHYTSPQLYIKNIFRKVALIPSSGKSRKKGSLFCLEDPHNRLSSSLFSPDDEIRASFRNVVF